MSLWSDFLRRLMVPATLPMAADPLAADPLAADPLAAGASVPPSRPAPAEDATSPAMAAGDAALPQPEPVGQG